MVLFTIVPSFCHFVVSVQVVVDPDTGEPSDNLTDIAIEFCKSVGSEAKTVSEILATKDEKIMKAIQEGIDRANGKSLSRAQKVGRSGIEIGIFKEPGNEEFP